MPIIICLFQLRDLASILSAVVTEGGHSIGCVSSHIHTNRLLVWDTLEVLAAILTV